ncbi:MAG: tungsten formylmethanofuran dehydrogenase [Bacteroidetes bacterium]|nr:tungsten formylmethanofuran dehydrogenase [Bacteroidota bacterium]MBV6461319.1 1-deoxy-D-xylulose-5-phosphate synthase [Flavobacteriales bacterium]WKZ75281.1 MAG: thiamine pyrophosphate-dependent enzyme [Vicingaceae bacterium]MCL4816548.1 tungsten formylmethanofuran dehydrogenase [Flavobacteriales bacterium]NOG94356.1 tungsten formylmethanofuran dehydrogenase [Bacteroidota bacterium]
MEEKVLPLKEPFAISENTLLKAWRLLCAAKAMSELFEENKSVTSKYVHATSRGHEALQIAVGMQLKPCDWVAPYYRDDAMLLAIGLKPFDLMLQLLAKRKDPFSGGRTYYCHPSLNSSEFPKIPHQSSATGMQAIPTTGVAMGIQYKEKLNLNQEEQSEKPVVVCSFGDASITEGEVAEAFQMAALKKLPIIYLVQDNEWDISAHAKEIRAQDATQYAKAFSGIETRTINGSDFFESYTTFKEVIEIVRKERRPFLIHAKVPLLNHHTSGVRKEWYRDDLPEQQSRDPYHLFFHSLTKQGFKASTLQQIEVETKENVQNDYNKAIQEEDPKPEEVSHHIFAPTPITEETGERAPAHKQPTVMVDSALFAIRELMEKHPECLLYGQDVGARLGGVFREAATLAQQFGNTRVFNTPIQEAFIIGSTVGMSAVGLKPIVEVQFADYIWPGLNQLFTEVSRSCYLSNGKWPVSMILRVPIGAYGSGGPYHSSSVESVLTNIKGIKVAYPSTGADLKGLMKAAYYDPNPVVMLEHKGLYWSKIKGTEEAKTIEPDENYILPFGKARIVQTAEQLNIEKGNSLCVITYGRGVYWSKSAAKNFSGKVEIIDMRTLVPLDEETIFNSVKKHGRCLILTEEPVSNSFAMALAGLVQKNCFEWLDAPVEIVGALNIPALPLNSVLEVAYLPNEEKVTSAIHQLLSY